MKKLLLFIAAFAGMQSGLLLTMDPPEGWKPRPSAPRQSSRSSRPRPTAVNYHTTPINSTPVTYTNPLHQPTDSAADAELNFYMNPMPAALSSSSVEPESAASYNYQGFMMNNQSPAAHSAPQNSPTQSEVATDDSLSKEPAVLEGPTEKERYRLNKIEKDLDKIVEILKEMGFDLFATSLSAAGLDFIGAAFAASNSFITVPKLVYYYGNLVKHVSFLSSSKTSPVAKEELKRLTPRLQVVTRIMLKGPKALQSLAKSIMFVISGPKEAK